MNKLISTILILLHLSLYAQQKPLNSQSNTINKALSELKADKELKNASISFLAVDLKTNKTLASLNPDISIIPASTQKLFTTASALELAGPNYHFKTQIQYTGKIDTTTQTLNGDLIIKGGGDPTLGSKYFYKNNPFYFIQDIIKTLRNHKITNINGRIIADASIYANHLASPKWLWEEVANYYAISACGLSVFDNLYQIHFKSPPEAGKPVKIIKIYPEISGLNIQNEVLSSNIRSDEAYIFGAPYTYQRIIRGTIPKNKKDFVVKGALPDPAYFLAQKIKKQLDSAGIHTAKPATTIRLIKLNKQQLPDTGITIKTIYSPKLSDIISLTNHKSNNLYAEHLLNLIALKRNLKAIEQQAATRELINFWKEKGMDTKGLYIVDGSGLSRLNAISARQFIFLLKYMKNKSIYSDIFIQSLPVAGMSGTLKYFGRNTSLQGNMKAKSGSIERVRAYAGYLTTKSGQNIAFSINIANYNCSSYSLKQKITKLLLAISDFEQ